jgi:hypothetical protein
MRGEVAVPMQAQVCGSLVVGELPQLLLLLLLLLPSVLGLSGLCSSLRRGVGSG